MRRNKILYIPFYQTNHHILPLYRPKSFFFFMLWEYISIHIHGQIFTMSIRGVFCIFCVLSFLYFRNLSYSFLQGKKVQQLTSPSSFDSWVRRITNTQKNSKVGLRGTVTEVSYTSQSWDTRKFAVITLSDASKRCRWMANSVDPDHSLIRVYTVCPDLAVLKPCIIMAFRVNKIFTIFSGPTQGKWYVCRLETSWN